MHCEKTLLLFLGLVHVFTTQISLNPKGMVMSDPPSKVEMVAINIFQPRLDSSGSRRRSNEADGEITLNEVPRR